MPTPTTRSTSPSSSPPPSSELAAPAATSSAPNGIRAAPAVKTTGSTKASSRKASQPRLPIKELFTPWKPQITLPTTHPSWGQIPYPEDGKEPKARPDLPPARTSNAQTVPPLWEDRKHRFKPGRFHTSFESDEDGVNENPDGTLLDQENNLVILLLDMRPINRMNQQPRRAPTYYAYENGKPKDWTDLQTLKALNDRRREAIWRITCDPPWNEQERGYLAHLCENFPNASILELAERFNWRFRGDFREEHGFGFHHIHEGRTLESVRNEYLTHKDIYDHGRIPLPKRQEGDKTDVKKVGNRRVKSPAEIAMEKFTTLKEWQEACGVDKNGQKRGRPKKKGSEDVDGDQKVDNRTGDAEDSSSLSDLNDELFDLAGGNDPECDTDSSGLLDVQPPEINKPARTAATENAPTAIHLSSKPAQTSESQGHPSSSVAELENTEAPRESDPNSTIQSTSVETGLVPQKGTVAQAEQAVDRVVSNEEIQPANQRTSVPEKRSRDDSEDGEEQDDNTTCQKKRRLSVGSTGGLPRPISPLPQHCSSASVRLSQNFRRRSTGQHLRDSRQVNEQGRPQNMPSMYVHSALSAPAHETRPKPAIAFLDEDEDSEMTDPEE